MKILAWGDSHFRLDTPDCRGENDWREVLRYKMHFIRGVIESYKCSMWVHSGDIFHRSKVVPELECLAIQELKSYLTDPLIVVPGNHDLPYHRLDHLYRSSLGVLQEAGVVSCEDQKFRGVNVVLHPWGSKVRETEGDGISVALVHEGYWLEAPPYEYEGQEQHNVKKAAKKWSGYQVVISGHFHVPFCIRKKDLVWVNTGSTFIQSWAERENEEGVWVIDTETLTAEFVKDPIEPEVVFSSYVQKVERDERVEKFVSSLVSSKNVEANIDFTQSLYGYMEQVPEGVRQEITKALEEVG